MQSSAQSSTHAILIGFLMIVTLVLSPQLFASGSLDKTDDTNSAVKLTLIEKLIYKEKYSAAIKKLKQTLKSDKKNADAWNLLGYASRKSGDTVAADSAYKEALSINKDHLGALEYQGELFITMGNLEAARSNLDRLSELCPNGCEEQAELADALADNS